MRRYSSQCILALVALLLTQCSTGGLPDAGGLLAVAETNPQRNAIVGGWRLERKPVEGTAEIPTLVFIAFREDGSGLQGLYIKGRDGEVSESLTPFHWEYAGGGIWRITELKNESRFRYARGWLIESSEWWGREDHDLYKRCD